jgi:hypothetical protein
VVSALFPVVELADLVCSASAHHKVLAMLRGYFDDTGTHKGSPLVGAAGFVGDVTAWAALEAGWRAKLQGYGISDFHAYHCAQNEGEFAGVGQTERSCLVMELAHLISRHDLMPVAAAVHVTAWDQLRAVNLTKGAAFFDRYPRPFALCFDHCVQIAANWSKSFKDGEPIAMVFNEQASDADDAREIFDAYKTSKRYGAMLDSLTFTPARGRPPLQAVDLLANETFHYWLDLIAEPGAPLRDAIRIMWRTLDFNLARFYGLTGLVGAMRKFEP